MHLFNWCHSHIDTSDVRNLIILIRQFIGRRAQPTTPQKSMAEFMFRLEKR